MKRLCVFAFCAAVVSAVQDLAYNGKVGSAVSRECVNKCVDGQCVVYNTNDIEQCYNTAHDAPIYQLTKKKGTCLSRCVEEPSYWYAWCYVDNNGNYEYCNRNTTVQWVRKRKFTLSNGPCKDECQYYYTDGSNKNWYQCTHYFGGWDYCDPKFSYDYIQAQTANGYMCSGRCKDHNHDGTRWCYYGNRNSDTCALPALPRPREWSRDLEELFAINQAFNVSYSTRCKRETDDDEDTPARRVRMRTENLNNLATDLEEMQEFDYVYIEPSARDPDQPIYSYTTEPVGSSIKPRVLRAELYPRHVRLPRAERGRIPEFIYANLRLLGMLQGDHAGHLIAFTLHGPDELYNFVPQMGRLNQGDYASQEQHIRRFLRDPNHQDAKVDMLVIPLYRDNETRPRGIAMHVRYFLGNTLVDQFYEYLPNYPNYGIVSTAKPFSTTPPPSFSHNNILFSLAGC